VTIIKKKNTAQHPKPRKLKKARAGGISLEKVHQILQRTRSSMVAAAAKESGMI